MRKSENDWSKLTAEEKQIQHYARQKALPEQHPETNTIVKQITAKA